MSNYIEVVGMEVRKIDNLNSKILYTFNVNNKLYTLLYKICGFKDLEPNEYKYKIDSFIITFLIHAMRKRYSFKSRIPISVKLYYHLVYHIMPQIYRCNMNETSIIEVDCPLCNDKNIIAGKYVGTGLSCGVDSLATIYEYTDLMPIKEYKLTHVFYNKVGAHDGQIGKYDEKIENSLFNEQLLKAKTVSNALGLPLIVVDTNLNEVLSEIFGFSGYEQTHTLRNIGTILLFQQYFNKYYYADTYSLDQFAVNVNSDMAHYEKWLLPLLSNEYISFYSANRAMNRIEKTLLITNFELSYDNLLVCWLSGENCGKCDKCIRTQVTLDLLGKFNLYKESFDICNYRKHKQFYFAKIVCDRHRNYFYNEIYNYMVEKNIKLPSIFRLFNFRTVQLYSRIKRKLLYFFMNN